MSDTLFFWFCFDALDNFGCRGLILEQIAEEEAHMVLPMVCHHAADASGDGGLIGAGGVEEVAALFPLTCDE